MLARDIHDRLLARARALGLQGDGDEQLLDALLDREVPLPPPTEADCRRYFDQHPQLFRSGELVEADHILFAVDWPFVDSSKLGTHWMERIALSAEDKAKVLHGNSERLLKM